MAKTLKDHMHLFLLSDSPTHATAQAYGVTLPGIDPKPVLAMSARRGVTGALLKTRLKSGDSIVAYRDQQLTLLCTTDQKDALLAINGQDCYFVPLEHDDDGASLKVDALGSQQGYPVLLSVERCPPLDSAEQWWIVVIHIQEDSIE